MLPSKKWRMPHLSNLSALAIALLMSSLLAGCGDSKFKDLSNSELQDKFSECAGAESLSPGGAIICDNVRRECEDRASKKNRKICY